MLHKEELTPLNNVIFGLMALQEEYAELNKVSKDEYPHIAREIALANTKLEEASLWLMRAKERHLSHEFSKQK